MELKTKSVVPDLSSKSSDGWATTLISPTCFLSGVDDSDFSVVLSRVLAAIADVHKLGLRFVNYAVWSGLKVNRIEKFERVPSKYSGHPVIAACQKQLIWFRDEQCSLRFLKSGDATHPLARLQVHHFKGAIFQPRNTQAFTFDIHIHMVKAAFDVW